MNMGKKRKGGKKQKRRTNNCRTPKEFDSEDIRDVMEKFFFGEYQTINSRMNFPEGMVRESPGLYTNVCIGGSRFAGLVYTETDGGLIVAVYDFIPGTNTMLSHFKEAMGRLGDFARMYYVDVYIIDSVNGNHYPINDTGNGQPYQCKKSRLYKFIPIETPGNDGYSTSPEELDIARPNPNISDLAEIIVTPSSKLPLSGRRRICLNMKYEKAKMI